DAQYLRDREFPFALQPGVQGFPFEELHCQEGDTVVLAHLVNGDDVVVLERGRRPRLAQEALPRSVADSQPRPDRLEGHQAGELGQARVSRGTPSGAPGGKVGASPAGGSSGRSWLRRSIRRARVLTVASSCVSAWRSRLTRVSCSGRAASFCAQTSQPCRWSST